MPDIYTVAEAFALAGFPVPEDGVIGYGVTRHYGRGWFGRVSVESGSDRVGQGFMFSSSDMWVFYSGEPGYQFSPLVNLTNLPAKDAWQQLPGIVRDHPEVRAKVGL